ncbi:acyltransferase family protein [Fluviicola taffensis]|uniref:Acyltransferase 3 n=1 Tax=Fluviicola taffensis (strain DSM 16823 / NCIMB 13979 / RW262) TaxID=755732 RepID=F2II20_FLUTR|nr:acyltransferase [Fluviicola taffensis]AEA42720.1 acyltransferase 3 [Fluviicola taffensis DSM 16823]
MKKSTIYFKNLDGLRTICFLMVFFFHSFTSQNLTVLNSQTYYTVKVGLFSNGNLGVNFFFVLSGFLITYLLIVEKQDTKKINVIHFWIRRVLRIWPLYFFCVFFGFFLFPIIKSHFGQTSQETAHLINYVTFTSNFDFITNGRPDASILGVLWSVSIEEQFYLIWPLLLSLLPVKHYWILFSTLILASLGYRITHNNYYHIEFHTLSCMNDLVIGSFVAWLIIRYKALQNRIISSSLVTQVLPYFAFAVHFFVRDEILAWNNNLIPYERIFTSILMSWIILDQAININGIFRLSRFKLLIKSGKYTYGMYCLHFLAILITITFTKSLFHQDTFWTVLVIEPIISLLLTYFISIISYNYFEKYFLKLKHQFV